MLILDLCGGTGSWSRPYTDAGYDVLIVDPIANGQTVREFLETEKLRDIRGILAAPPCTEFAGCGARWRAEKNPELLVDAIQNVRDCLEIINRFMPLWWCLENPVGRLFPKSKPKDACVPEIGPWKHTFQPTDYGDPWSKRTCLWGNFNMPIKNPVERDPDPRIGQAVWYASPGPERQKLRSMTPPGFAKAFYGANP